MDLKNGIPVPTEESHFNQDGEELFYQVAVASTLFDTYLISDLWE
jgi:hypothetical protein